MSGSLGCNGFPSGEVFIAGHFFRFFSFRSKRTLFHTICLFICSLRVLGWSVFFKVFGWFLRNSRLIFQLLMRTVSYFVRFWNFRWIFFIFFICLNGMTVWTFFIKASQVIITATIEWMHNFWMKRWNKLCIEPCNITLIWNSRYIMDLPEILRWFWAFETDASLGRNMVHSSTVFEWSGEQPFITEYSRTINCA